MSTYSEFFTESLEVFTENVDDKLMQDPPLQEVNKVAYFSPISIAEDAAMAIFVFSLGT